MEKQPELNFKACGMRYVQSKDSTPLLGLIQSSSSSEERKLVVVEIFDCYVLEVSVLQV